MATMQAKQSIGIWVITVIFGLLTIKSGGSVLFVDGVAREEAGNYVPFVLWFNFLSGFAYLIAGAGLFMQKALGCMDVCFYCCRNNCRIYTFWVTHTK